MALAAASLVFQPLASLRLYGSTPPRDGAVQCVVLTAQLAAHLWAAGTVAAEKAAATRAHPAHLRLWPAGTVAAEKAVTMRAHPAHLRLLAAGTVAADKTAAKACHVRFRRLQPHRTKPRCLVAPP